MENILVFIQHDEGRVLKASLCALEAAIQLKSRWGAKGIYTIALGSRSRSASEEIIQYGVDESFYCEDQIFESYISSHFSEAVLDVMSSSNCDLFVAPSTSTGKDLSPRVAARIEASQASDIIAVNSDGTLKRPMFAGNVFADVELTSSKKVITVRGTAFQPAVKSSSNGVVKEFSVQINAGNAGEVIGYEMQKSERPELSDASVVVSGGRALGSAENFQRYIFPLADALGAAVGASRAAVDAGYAPNDWQVGQTGKVVAPNLYIAVGISGAIQHLAGMKDSKVIVAINKDPEAPIFEIADYGLVGDLYEVVDPLVKAIREARS